MSDTFVKQLKELFGNSFSAYYENPKQGTVSFEVEMPLNFEDAHKVSEILGTDKIRLVANKEDGSCDTCSYGERTFMELQATEVNFPSKHKKQEWEGCDCFNKGTPHRH